MDEIFIKQSRGLLALRSRQDDNTRKSLVVSSGGMFVWSGDDAGNVCIWDSQTGTCIKRLHTPSRRRVCSLAVFGEGTRTEQVWVGCQGGSISTYDTRTLELWGLLPGHTQDVLAIVKVADTMWTAAGSLVYVWENCASPDPHVAKELNCVGRDILSLLASSTGAFVFCGSIAGFVVLDAVSGETLHVGRVDEGITDVVEVLPPRGKARGGEPRGCEIWCVHGNSVLGCWDAATFSSGQCKHVDNCRVSGLVSLASGEVWSGASDGTITVWNVKNKRVVRSLGEGGEPVSSMVAVVNDLLGVLTVWVAHYDGSVAIWVASDLSTESIESAQHMRNQWKARHENLAQIRSLREGRGFGDDVGGTTDGSGGRVAGGMEGRSCVVT